MTRQICVTAVAVIVLGGGQVCANNLVVNGDFESGNMGFISGYAYDPSGGYPDTNYAVASNPNAWNSNWSAYGDHTSGSGLMMIVNGSTLADTLIWSETFSVSPNTLYNFSIWVSSCNTISPANLDFVFNGSAPIPYDAPAAAGVWQQLTMGWNSGANTSVSIQVYDRNLEYVGNDFAIDDISLSAVPEPSSFILSGIGAISLLAYAWRRRRKA
jgi:hypothetical protein